MGALLATIYVGSRSTFGDDINPYDIIELHESDGLAFVWRSLSQLNDDHSWINVRPERLAETLFAILGVHLDGYRDHPLARHGQVFLADSDDAAISELAAAAIKDFGIEIQATLHEASPLRAEDFAALTNASVVIFQQTYARLRQSDNTWRVEGSLQ